MAGQYQNISPDSANPLSTISSVADTASSLMQPIAMGENIYDTYKNRNGKAEQWGVQKRLLNQQYIKQQRDLDWMQQFRDKMLFGSLQTGGVTAPAGATGK